MYTENEQVAKYEIMDGAPVRGKREEEEVDRFMLSLSLSH